MKQKILSLAGVAFMAAGSLGVTGCANRMLDFTAISSKNVEVDGTRGERVRGESMAFLLPFCIPVKQPNIKEAVDRAIERGGGDMLIDGVVYYKGWCVFLFGQMGYSVEGTIVNTHRKAK